MIFLRTLLLVLGTAAAYALLRGWPGAVPPLLRACAAVLVLVAALGLWAKRSRRPAPAAQGRRPPGLMDYVAITAVVLAVESGFLWLLSATPVPLENVAASLEERLRPQAAAARLAADRPQPAASGNWLWDNQTRRPLPRRTNLQPGNRPEVFVRLRDPGDATELLRQPLYVQAFALGHYRQAAWSAGDGPAQELQADAAGFVQLPARPGRTVVHEVFHNADTSGETALTAIQGVVAVRVPRLTRLAHGLHLLPPPTSNGSYEYLAASAPRRLEDLADLPDVAAGEIAQPSLLELPETGPLGQRLRDLASLAAGSGSLPQRLLNLQNHLRANIPYSLQTLNSQDLDPLENFLFHEQRGHCEYFATAGALLARAIGVPSRTAYGWVGGTYYENSNMFVFRSREAHAWTEVWLRDQGWVVMDPTPPSAIGAEAGRVAPPGEPLPTAEPPTSEPVQAGANGVATPPARIALILVACFGLPAAVVLAGRRLLARRVHEPITGIGDDGRTPPPGYLLAWRQASARRGMPMKQGMTLRRHLAGAEGVPFAHDLLEYHYNTRYEGGVPDPKREKRLVAAIRRWGNDRDQTSISNPSR